MVPPHKTTGFFFAGKNSNLGAGSDAGQVRRNFRQWPPTGQPENFFAEVVGLDDNLDIFWWEESRPWCGLGRAPMLGRWRGPGGFYAGQARQGGAVKPYDRMTV